MKSIASRLMASAGAVAIVALVSGPAAAQDVRRSGNGWEVRYPGPCTVYYGPTGNRTYALPSCTGQQRRAADDAVRGWIANANPGYPINPGYPGYPGGGWGAAEPIVNINSGGWGTVNLRNGCVVTFDQQGNRIGDTRPCNSQMRNYARQLFLNGLYGGNYTQGWPGYGEGYAQADVSVYGNTLTVRMRGTNCTYYYTTGGNHYQSVGSQCNSRLRNIANQAVRDWRGRYR